VSLVVRRNSDESGWIHTGASPNSLKKAKLQYPIKISFCHPPEHIRVPLRLIQRCWCSQHTCTCLCHFWKIVYNSGRLTGICGSIKSGLFIESALTNSCRYKSSPENQNIQIAQKGEFRPTLRPSRTPQYNDYFSNTDFRRIFVC
jgi:hypothetical protein